jgi:parvulin-like peptidyl-prolyl isomerase
VADCAILKKLMQSAGGGCKAADLSLHFYIMKKSVLLPVVLMMAPVFFSPSCRSKSAEKAPSEIVVARVNGHEIKGDLFLERYRRVKKRLKVAEPRDANLKRKFREKVLAKIIDAVLMYQEAEKTGIKTDPHSRDETIRSLLEGFTPASLRLVLEQSETTLGSWKESVKENLIIENLIKKEVVPLVQVPEKEIKKYFREHRKKFHLKERVHAYHIVVPTLSEADKIRSEIIEGAEFSETAKQFSISPDSANGGDLGIFEKGRMPQEFDNVLFKLKINHISEVVESPYGFHIFKVTRKLKPRAMSYSESRETIFKQMFYERLERRFKEWIDAIRRKAHIEIYSERLYRL